MGINEIIAAYIQEKETETAAKKRAAAMKSLLLEYAGGRDNFTTDVYTVIVKTSTSCRLDTSALLLDFPDIKDVYGKDTTSTTITAVVTADAEKENSVTQQRRPGFIPAARTKKVEG